MIEQKILSRRSFLAGAGIVTGAAVVATGTSLLNPKSAEAAFTALPWPYATLDTALDTALVKQRGYDHYMASGGCMAGTAKALIVTLLANNPGTAWETIPQAMFKYGRGGIGGSWGSLCGALNGAALVIQACAPSSTVATNLINALYDWYCNNLFPSNTGYDTVSHLVDTTTVVGMTAQHQTVSKSPLCHASVSNWCHAAVGAVGYSYTKPLSPESAEKKQRCAMVSGDVAEKTAQLLNTYFASSTIPGFTQPDSGCASCHLDNNSQHWVQMKSSCTTMCHDPVRNSPTPAGSTCTRNP